MRNDLNTFMVKLIDSELRSGSVISGDEIR